MSRGSTEVRSRGPAYALVVRSAGFGRWTAVAVLARLPLAMMPLGLVLVGSAAGSLPLGAVLSGAFVAGEVTAAPFLARRLPLRRGLLGTGVAALALGLAAAAEAPAGVLVALAVGVGVVGAGAPGQVRVWLGSLVPPDARPAAYSLESTGSAALYVAGPALVALASTVGRGAGMLLAAGLVVVAAALVPGTGGLRADGPSRHAPLSTVLRRLWPGCVTASCFMGAVATVDVAVPALLVADGRPATSSGPLLAAFATTGVAGGLLYGARSWPGRPVLHAGACTAAAILVLGLLPVVGVGLVLVVLLVAGLFGPPSLVARSLEVQRVLAEPELAVGFSLVSAASGAGAALASFAMGVMLASVPVDVALLGVLGVLLAGAVAMTGLELAGSRAPDVRR